MDLDPVGRVYAVDTYNCRVQIYNPDGSYYATLGTGCGAGPYEFKDPQGVAVAPDGTIYVADSANHRVQLFDASRTYLATLGQTGESGSDNAHLNEPHDVAVDAAGNIYVVDHWNFICLW